MHTGMACYLQVQSLNDFRFWCHVLHNMLKERVFDFQVVSLMFLQSGKLFMLKIVSYGKFAENVGWPYAARILCVHTDRTWWRHQMETLSSLLAIWAGNSPVTGEFPAQRPVTQSFDVFFDLRSNKRLSKQSWVRWFETHSRPLWSYDCYD